jgi:hypothetical protein
MTSRDIYEDIVKIINGDLSDWLKMQRSVELIERYGNRRESEGRQREAGYRQSTEKFVFGPGV